MKERPPGSDGVPGSTRLITDIPIWKESGAPSGNCKVFMPKLAIIHFNPIESYPPVMNWLNLLAAHCGAGLKVSVITMAPAGGRSLFRTDPPCIGIRRAGSAGRRGWRGYLNYLLFYLTAFFHLLVRRPDKVLYYETLSALPAFLYKQFARRGAELYIHYHEYTSP